MLYSLKCFCGNKRTCNFSRYISFVSDFYPELNATGAGRCCLEFCGDDISSIRDLRSIIGKHVYNKIVTDGKNEYADLVIE